MGETYYVWPCGLMDKALVFGTKDCRFESCQGHECVDACGATREFAKCAAHGAVCCCDSDTTPREI